VVPTSGLEPWLDLDRALLHSLVHLGPRWIDLGNYLLQPISLELLLFLETSLLVLWPIWRILLLAILVRVVLPLLLGMGMDLVELVENLLVVVNVSPTRNAWRVSTGGSLGSVEHHNKKTRYDLRYLFLDYLLLYPL